MVSIALSLAALVISIASWWEARRARVINEESARPMIHVSSVQLSRAGDREIAVTATLSNLGHTAAQKISFSYTPTIYENSKFPLQPLHSQPFMPREKTIAEIAPTVSLALSNGETVAESFAQTQVDVNGTIAYEDGITTKRYQEKWCFRGFFPSTNRSILVVTTSPCEEGLFKPVQ